MQIISYTTKEWSNLPASFTEKLYRDPLVAISFRNGTVTVTR